MRIRFGGDVDPQLGWDLDFAERGEHFLPLLQGLDQTCSNDPEGLQNPPGERPPHLLCARHKPHRAGPCPMVVHQICTARYMGICANGPSETTPDLGRDRCHTP